MCVKMHYQKLQILKCLKIKTQTGNIEMSKIADKHWQKRVKDHTNGHIKICQH